MVPTYAFQDPEAPVVMSFAESFFSPAPLAVGIPSLLQQHPSPHAPPHARERFVADNHLIAMEPCNSPAGPSPSGHTQNSMVLSLDADLTLVALHCLGLVQHADVFLQAGLRHARGFLSLLLISPADLRDGMRLWRREMEARLPGLSSGDISLLQQLVEGTNRKCSGPLQLDAPALFSRLMACGVEQFLWMGLELADETSAYNDPSSYGYLEGSLVRGVGFSIRLDAAQLPAAPHEREVLREQLEAQLKQTVPNACIHSLVHPDARRVEGTLMVCWCPASVMDVVAALPSGLVTLTRRLATEGATFAGHRVLRFPDGSPSPRVECYDVQLQGSPSLTAGLQRLEWRLGAFSDDPSPSTGVDVSAKQVMAEQVAKKVAEKVAEKPAEKPADGGRSCQAAAGGGGVSAAAPSQEVAAPSQDMTGGSSVHTTMDDMYESIARCAPQGRGLRANRGEKAKLIDFLFNPKTWRESIDKLPHEEPSKQGSKTGGHFVWLLRQV